MSDIAYLKILEAEKITLNQESIHEELKKVGFNEIRPAEEYTPNGYEHRFVVWRHDNQAKVTDEDVQRLVGKDGNVLYFWQCPHCKLVVRKCEYPGKPQEDVYYGCSCRGTTWGVPII